MPLDISSLKKAVDALERSLRVAKETAGSLDRDLAETVQSGVIQKFKLAYDQSGKLMQRKLRDNPTSGEAEFPHTRKELFRMAARYGLIDDPIPWFSYGDARNLTSHTYDAKQSASVYDSAKRFLADAQTLLARLEALYD